MILNIDNRRIYYDLSGDPGAPIITLLHRLEAENGTMGLAAICGNGGHGASMLIERAA